MIKVKITFELPDGQLIEALWSRAPRVGDGVILEIPDSDKGIEAKVKSVTWEGTGDDVWIILK